MFQRETFGPPFGTASARGTVWLLEDSPLEAEMARRALSSHHSVEVFSEASSVLERVANDGPPDVLVVDWQLPGLSGLEVSRFLRATHDEMELPILMLTSYGQKRDVVEGLEAGANDYITKPYDVAELVARVSTLVRTSRLGRDQARRYRQLMMSAGVGIALTRQRTPALALDECVRAIATQTEGARVLLWGVEDGEPREIAQASGPELPIEGGADRVTLVREVLALEKPVFVQGPATSAWLAPHAWACEGCATFAAYPLVVEGASLGALVVLGARSLSTDTLEAIAAVADVVALGLDRARAERERAVLYERELRARADAEAANRSKDEFLATVSHELRTPLNAIAGWVHMLKTGSLSPERAQRAFETIERNTRAQTQLVDDLLDVSRIIAGTLRLEMFPVRLAPVIESAAEALRPSAAAKGVALVVEIDANVRDVAIVGDADRMQQVIANLVGNAIKFTPARGSVSLRLGAEGEHAVVAVRDTGVGINADFLPHLFGRFTQAEGTFARKQGGLGLGLAIVRHLVERHGGAVSVASEGEGKGATFTVKLPRADAPVIESEPVHGLALSTPTQFTGLTVLVVDDDDAAREVMRALLERGGATVLSAASAAEALEAVKRSKPDALISDIGMPGEDGLALIRKVRALGPGEGGDVPAIALTAYAGLDDRAKAIAAGFTAHVPKPLDATDLLATLARIVERSKLA